MGMWGRSAACQSDLGGNSYRVNVSSWALLGKVILLFYQFKSFARDFAGERR